MPFTLRPDPIAGVQIAMGGQTFTVPALTLGQLDGLDDQLTAISAMTEGRLTKSGRDAMVAIVHAAVTRNYPSAEIEEVRGLLDLRNVTDALNAVLAISGLEKKDAPTGEE